MNLDMLASAGEPPWLPSHAAHDLDAWEKYDIPTCGTFRHGTDLVMFTLITTAGRRSLWAYVPVPAADEDAVACAQFDGEAEFDAFIETRFAGREAVFAAAEKFVITTKSDGIRIGDGPHALLEAGTRWYALRAAALAGRSITPAETLIARAAAEPDADALVRVAQVALTGSPA